MKPRNRVKPVRLKKGMSKWIKTLENGYVTQNNVNNWSLVSDKLQQCLYDGQQSYMSIKIYIIHIQNKSKSRK